MRGSTPFSTDARPLHLFFKHYDLHIHIVVFHQVKHFLWVGRIAPKTVAELDGFNIHFGRYEEIYDPFSIQSRRLKGLLVDESARSHTIKLNYPDDIEYFLSQILTSKYMHCPEERKDWLRKNNISISTNRIEKTINAIQSFKSLMRELKMEFWAMCGTLLGKGRFSSFNL